MCAQHSIGQGEQLEINYATSAAGSLRMGIQDVNGKAGRLRFVLSGAHLCSVRPQ